MYFAQRCCSHDPTSLGGLIARSKLDTVERRLLWMLQAHIGVHYQGDDLVTRGFASETARWTLPTSGAVIEKCGYRRGLQYRIEMKRQPSKLVLRRETLRSFSGLELRRVVGAGEVGVAAIRDTAKEVCTSLIDIYAPPVG